MSFPPPPDPCGRFVSAQRRYGPIARSLHAQFPYGSLRPFFFLRCECILDRTQNADLLADRNDLSTEFLKPMKLGHFLLCLAQRCRSRECLGHGLASNPARQAEVGAVTRVVAFRAVTIGFTTLARGGCDRAPPQIANRGELAEQVGSFGLQLRQRVGHG